MRTLNIVLSLLLLVCIWNLACKSPWDNTPHIWQVLAVFGSIAELCFVIWAIEKEK